MPSDPPSSTSARNGLLRAAAALLAVACTGCFQVESLLNRDGSGTMTITYPGGPNLEAERAKFSSPNVSVHSITPAENKAVLQASFNDVTKLSTAEAFRTLIVRRQAVPGGERLRVIVRNPKPSPSPNVTAVGSIAVTLPGPVTSANRGAERHGNQVVWRIPIADLAAHRFTKLSVRYAVAGA
ncbi:MAG: hypothetical protein E6J55_01460 [Deltaproteobacteria bacterium]|nr:MAG: hypothetical protein E6J55_01460 [Deltaproteobacteria bacterium]